MRAFWTARVKRMTSEDGAFGMALGRIRAGDEGWAAAEAEAAFRQVLGAGAKPDLVRICLERIAAGPDTRAAIIALGALRPVGDVGDQSAETAVAGSDRK
jgi:hypothetical protein